jgi:hypothetical protein
MSTLGRRTLVATFLRPETSSIRRTTFLTAYIRRSIGTSTPRRREKGLISHSDGDLYISPYYDKFAQNCAQRRIFPDPAYDVPGTVVELIKRASEAATQAPYSEDFSDLSHITNEASWLGAVHPRLFPWLPGLSTDSEFVAVLDARWKKRADLAPALSLKLTAPKPDITYAFSSKYWTDSYPLACEAHSDVVLPRRDTAFPFFVSEGKYMSEYKTPKHEAE